MSTYETTRKKLRQALGLDGGARPAHRRTGSGPSGVPRVVIRGERKQGEAQEQSPLRGETESLDERKDGCPAGESLHRMRDLETRFWDEDNSETEIPWPGKGGRIAFKRVPVPLESHPAQAAHVDALCFTVRPPEAIRDSERDSLLWILPVLVKHLGCKGLKPTGGGWQGYKKRLDLQEVPGALLAIGGKKQRGTLHVELMGKACARIQDWEGIKQWGEDTGARITRIDLAHDDYQGEHVDVDKAVQWHEQGGFKNGGRPPSTNCIGDWKDTGSPKGRTFEIGQRGNGKFCRVYEKGKEQGNPTSPWTRVEVEWRAQGRILTWDMLVQPGQYLAGAYPCLKYLSERQDKVRTIRKAAGISLERATENLRHMGGKVVNVLLQAHGDFEKVVKAIIRPGIPSRLDGYQGLVSWPELVIHENP